MTDSEDLSFKFKKNIDLRKKINIVCRKSGLKFRYVHKDDK